MPCLISSWFHEPITVVLPNLILPTPSLFFTLPHACVLGAIFIFQNAGSFSHVRHKHALINCLTKCALAIPLRLPVLKSACHLKAYFFDSAPSHMIISPEAFPDVPIGCHGDAVAFSRGVAQGVREDLPAVPIAVAHYYFICVG